MHCAPELRADRTCGSRGVCLPCILCTREEGGRDEGRSRKERTATGGARQDESRRDKNARSCGDQSACVAGAKERVKEQVSQSACGSVHLLTPAAAAAHLGLDCFFALSALLSPLFSFHILSPSLQRQPVCQPTSADSVLSLSLFREAAVPMPVVRRRASRFT